MEYLELSNEEVKIAKANWSRRSSPMHNSFEFLPDNRKLEEVIFAYRALLFELHKVD